MSIGNKIKQLRIKNGLTQEELANRSELSKGFISQVERDLTSPSISTLVDILECLGTNLKDFFNDTEQEKIVFREEDVFVKEDNDIKISWIIPNAQKNKMEPILVTLAKQASTDIDTPHEGEEFGYVLKGNIYIFLGTKKFKAKKGESFYYKPILQHYIKNAGNSCAEFLWVSTPPSF